jgi:amino acid transporter
MLTFLINMFFIIAVLLFFITLCLCAKSTMLIRYYSNNYDKIRNQETRENYPRTGY